MTTGGWILLVLSVGFVSCLTFYCFYRVFTTPHSEEHLHAPLDIDTQDKEP